MEEKVTAIAIEEGDRFGEHIRKIVDGERNWPASRGHDAAEIEAERRALAQEFFTGVELIDLVGHSTPIKCCLKLGDWVLDRTAAEKLASYLPDSVQIVRLIGCSTASTEEGRAAAVAITRYRRKAYGTVNKVFSTHFDKQGVKDGIGAPPMRGFIPTDRAPVPLPAAGGTADERRSRGLLVWLGRRPWKAILRIYRRIRRLLPWQEDPWSRISRLLHPGGAAMPGLLTEPLFVFGVASRAGTWTLEILFDFECARFYASVDAAGDRSLVYKIRGFGQFAKTPLEAYLERGPRGVTLIRRHEEAGNRCDGVPPPGSGITPPRHLFSLVVLATAAAVALALLVSHLVNRSGSVLPPDAMADGSGKANPINPPHDAGLSMPPIDAPPDTVPMDGSGSGGGPTGCAEEPPTATYQGFVAEYTSPETYGDVVCRRSLSLQINDYSASYVGARDTAGTFVTWAGYDLTGSDCAAAWVRADLYRYISGRWKSVSSKESHGVWEPTGLCHMPLVGWSNADDGLIASSDYRIVATARTSLTGTTHRFRVVSRRANDCAALEAAAKYTGFASEYTSPRVYGATTCPGSLAIEINNYSASYVDGGAGGAGGGTFVGWADADPTTKSACESAWVQADLYRHILGGWIRVNRQQNHGTWMNFFGSWSCQTPGVGWRTAHEGLVAGSDYRIVATARTSPTGATQKLRVVSQTDGPVPK
jgi:hypothetical protein